MTAVLLSLGLILLVIYWIATSRSSSAATTPRTCYVLVSLAHSLSRYLIKSDHVAEGVASLQGQVDGLAQMFPNIDPQVIARDLAVTR